MWWFSYVLTTANERAGEPVTRFFRAGLLFNYSIHNMGNPSDHLANERTFLAWIRTSIGIMAFGFVVVKFTLFMRQLGLVLQKNIAVPEHGYSAAMGIFLVAFGAAIGLFSFTRYKRVEQQLNDQTYKHGHILTTILAVSVVLMGLLLVVYLVRAA